MGRKIKNICKSYKNQEKEEHKKENQKIKIQGAVKEIK